jgi:hypothetical protein
MPAPHELVPRPAVSAAMSTMTAAIAAAIMTTAPTPSTASWPSASASTPRAAVRAIPSRSCSLWSSVAVEVWLALFFLEITAAFDGHGSRWRGSRFRTAAHLGALFLQDGLAGQPDPVTFHRKHLYEYLVAFFQLIADVLDAMLGDFTDVQEPIGSGQNFDKRTEVGQS